MTTVSPEVLKATARNVIAAFLREFGRVPTPAEREILASAIVRYFDEPDAPTTRLQ